MDTFDMASKKQPYLSIDKLSYVEKYIHVETIESTNIYALNLTEFPRKGLFVIRSNRQSHGRGRGTNSFFSDIKGGLWVSVVCPISSLDNHFVYNRAISLAIADTINCVTALKASIKWPNDIYINDRKICGILLQTIASTNSHIVIGFGLNVNISEEQFPAELRKIATSLLIETGLCFDLDMLLHGILHRFELNRCNKDINHIHSLYRKALYRIGSPVEVEGKAGFFVDVDEGGRLLIKTANSYEYIMSGSLRYI